jgi:hypothetical protein
MAAREILGALRGPRRASGLDGEVYQGPPEDRSTPPIDLAIPVFDDQNRIAIGRGFGLLRNRQLNNYRLTPVGS